MQIVILQCMGSAMECEKPHTVTAQCHHLYQGIQAENLRAAAVSRGLSLYVFHGLEPQ